MTSTVDVVAKATRISSAIDSHVDDDCKHCKALIKSAVVTSHGATDEPVQEQV